MKRERERRSEKIACFYRYLFIYLFLCLLTPWCVLNGFLWSSVKTKCYYTDVPSSMCIIMCMYIRTCTHTRVFVCTYMYVHAVVALTTSSMF